MSSEISSLRERNAEFTSIRENQTKAHAQEISIFEEQLKEMRSLCTSLESEFEVFRSKSALSKETLSIPSLWQTRQKESTAAAECEKLREQMEKLVKALQERAKGAESSISNEQYQMLFEEVVVLREAQERHESALAERDEVSTYV